LPVPLPLVLSYSDRSDFLRESSVVLDLLV
jgi:hypothetical protein